MTDKRTIIAAGLALVLAAGAWHQLGSTAATAEAAPAAVEIPKISIEEVGRLLSDSTVRVFDANSPSLFAKGHVPGARNIAFDAVTADALPADKATKIIFYCMNERCSASIMAARQAASLGYTNVFHMAAGIQGWIKAGQPVEKG